MIDVTKLSGVYMTTAEAAEYICITRGRIGQMLVRGEIDGLKIGPRSWLISQSEADRVKDAKHNCGRPRVTKMAG